MSGWTGPQYPNNTGKQPGWPNLPIGNKWSEDCGDGQLYDIIQDPNEHSNLVHKQNECHGLIFINQPHYIEITAFRLVNRV